MLGNILEIKEESLNDRNFGIVSGRIQPTSQSLPRSYILHKGRVGALIKPFLGGLKKGNGLK